MCMCLVIRRQMCFAILTPALANFRTPSLRVGLCGWLAGWLPEEESSSGFDLFKMENLFCRQQFVPFPRKPNTHVSLCTKFGYWTRRGMVLFSTRLGVFSRTAAPPLQRFIGDPIDCTNSKCCSRNSITNWLLWLYFAGYNLLTNTPRIEQNALYLPPVQCVERGVVEAAEYHKSVGLWRKNGHDRPKRFNSLFAVHLRIW